MSVQITMVAARTSAGTGELVMSVTVLLGTNSWTKRPVEVKNKKIYAAKLLALMQKTVSKG